MTPGNPSSSLRPEFSRPVRADSVSARESTETITASAEERRALAERFELEAIDGLTATLRLRRVRGGTTIRVAGDLHADVVQTCIVTLDPVLNHVEESFSALFVPPDLVPDESAELDLDPLGDDDLEPLENGRIDLGELTAQHLSLALDPYPRAPDLAAPEGIAAPEGLAEEVPGETDADADAVPVAPPNPFASLAKLKKPN